MFLLWHPPKFRKSRRRCGSLAFHVAAGLIRRSRLIDRQGTQLRIPSGLGQHGKARKDHQNSSHHGDEQSTLSSCSPPAGRTSRPGEGGRHGDPRSGCTIRLNWPSSCSRTGASKSVCRERAPIVPEVASIRYLRATGPPGMSCEVTVVDSIDRRRDGVAVQVLHHTLRDEDQSEHEGQPAAGSARFRERGRTRSCRSWRTRFA